MQRHGNVCSFEFVSILTYLSLVCHLFLCTHALSPVTSCLFACDGLSRFVSLLSNYPLNTSFIDSIIVVQAHSSMKNILAIQQGRLDTDYNTYLQALHSAHMPVINKRISSKIIVTTILCLLLVMKVHAMSVLLSV